MNPNVCLCLALPSFCLAIFKFHFDLNFWKHFPPFKWRDVLLPYISVGRSVLQLSRRQLQEVPQRFVLLEVITQVDLEVTSGRRRPQGFSSRLGREEETDSPWKGKIVIL